MTRPVKATVEYFAHRCRHGRVIYVMESLWGNNGYSFFYKVYELLGDAEGHVFNLDKAGNRDYLLSYTRLDGDIVNTMLNKLSELGILDKELLSHGILWSQVFVDDLEHVYHRRRVEKPVKPVLCQHKTDSVGHEPANGQQESANDMIVNDSKVNDIKDPLQDIKDISCRSSSEDALPPSDNQPPKKKKGKKEEGVDFPTCPHQDIIELYHEICKTMPRVAVWNEERQGFLRGRWREKPERQNLDWWKEYLTRASKSDFLAGRTEPGYGHKTFVADLEWLVRPTNFVKVLEGRYDNRGPVDRPKRPVI